MGKQIEAKPPPRWWVVARRKGQSRATSRRKITLEGGVLSPRSHFNQCKGIMLQSTQFCLSET